MNSTKYRTQLQNRKDAMKKLRVLLKRQEKESKKKDRDKQIWANHENIIQGNPVVTFVGETFVIRKQ